MTTSIILKGTIVHMSLDKARPNYSKTRDEYSMRLLVDGNTPEGANAKKQVQEVNSNKVVTKSEKVNIPPGHFMVSAWSFFQPAVYNSEGQKVEEVPYFTKGSTGTAVMEVKPFEGKKGDGLNLQRVSILTLQLAENTPKENVGEQSFLEALAKIKKG